MTELRPALIIFDCDGVLVDSEPIGDRVMARYFTDHGWPCEAELVNELFVGGTMEGAGREAARRGADLPEGWLAALYQLTFEALAREVRPIPGIATALDALDAAGLPCCVASNGPHAKMDVTLEATGLAARFAGRRFSAHDLARPKPAPDLFLHAADRLGAAPGACVVVEDSRTGVRAARAANMRCLAYAPHDDGAALRALGGEPFAAMSELPALLGL